MSHSRGVHPPTYEHMCLCSQGPYTHVSVLGMGEGVCICGDSFRTHMTAEERPYELKTLGSSIWDVCVHIDMTEAIGGSVCVMRMNGG